MATYNPETPSSYVTPLEAGIDFYFVSTKTIYPNVDLSPSAERYYQKIEYNGKEIWDNNFIYANVVPPIVVSGRNIGKTINLKSGTYKITYEVWDYEDGGNHQNLVAKSTYTFAVVENHYPLKKQTVLDVIQRVLDVCEPRCAVRRADGTVYDVTAPRFSFEFRNPENTPEGIEERALFNQTAPEFTFTRMTLRECLQEVGRFIHAEPRLRKGKISFDRYGAPTIATYKRNSDFAVQTFPLHPYSGKRHRIDINEACTQVDSHVDNYVNRLDDEGGTVAEPFRNGAITLRSNVVYTRLEDSEELYFPTNSPIMDISSFKWVDVLGLAGKKGARYDITEYIFEKNVYDTQLSSYSASYPYSKSYGLYFTLGEKDIKGFFFKNDDWSGGVLKNYAILNILQQVTGKTLDLSDPTDPKKKKRYQTLCFELVYTPIYAARVTHGKSNLRDMLKRPFTMNYNQSANVVETRYYGEHVKGVAERLGNAEKSFDLPIRNVGNLPKIGQKWDDDYYISAVKGATFRDRICVSVTLSKNFNRLSAYVGANSYKRVYEVSERMSQERDMTYKDYLVITEEDEIGRSESDCFIGQNVMMSVANTFCQDPVYWSEIVSAVTVQGHSKQFNPQNTVILPVISSGFGNVMAYTWEYADNYSAGTFVTEQPQTGTDVKGYFGAEAQYGDYYGRMYYQTWSLQTRSLAPNVGTDEGITIGQALSLPNAFGDVNAKTFAKTPSTTQTTTYQIVRKDSREKLNQTYEIEFVTDMEGLIIGSALARNNPTIGGLQVPEISYDTERVALYLLPNPVNKFSNVPLDLTDAEKVYMYDGSSYGSAQNSQIRSGGLNKLIFNGVVVPSGTWKAWAIVSGKIKGEPYWEEDEDGEKTLFTPESGNEILIAQNRDFTAGDIVGKFQIVAKHDIFAFMKNKGGQQ